MTTLSIRLDDRTARRLSRRSAERGQSTEDLLRAYAERVAELDSIREFAEQNAKRLRKAGFTSEEEVQAMFEAEIKAHRAENDQEGGDR